MTLSLYDSKGELIQRYFSDGDQTEGEEINVRCLQAGTYYLAVDYHKNRPNNVISYAMWQVLTNKDRYLLVGFFEYWEKKGQLSEVFIEEAEEQINYAMGLLFNYELLKNRESENAIQKYINTP